MATIDSSMIKSVMESPVPIAALTVVCFVAWRQMSLVRNTVKDTLHTFRVLFSDQNKAAKDNAEIFKSTSKEFGAKVDSLADKLTASSIAVSELNSKLTGIPTLIDSTVEQKLRLKPDIASAIEDRIKNLENRQIIQQHNVEKIIEGLKKLGGK